MPITYLLPDYKGSKDYARLVELAKKQSVICIVTVNGCRDVAKTLCSVDSGAEEWQVGARGIPYICAFTEASFIEKCEAVQLEFIEPPA